MTGWVSLGVLVAASSIMLAIGCALALSLALHFSHSWLERAAMQGRSGLLLLLAVAPMLASAIIMTACMVPSLLAGVGLISDHCLTSFHDHLHLCLQHLPTIGPGNTAWLLTLLGVAAFGTAAWTAVRDVARGRSAFLSLAALAERREGIVDWLDSPAALSLTAGLMRPRVFISRGFASEMDDGELRAAVAHERCHARERHGLIKLAALCGSMIHVPGTRNALLHLLDLALERRADESAAEEVGDRLRVATAIVLAHRAAPLARSPLVLALGASSIERRVVALLAPPVPWSRNGERRLMIALAALAAAASFEIHHAVEVAISLLV